MAGGASKSLFHPRLKVKHWTVPKPYPRTLGLQVSATCVPLTLSRIYTMHKNGATLCAGLELLARPSYRVCLPKRQGVQWKSLLTLEVYKRDR